MIACHIIEIRGDIYQLTQPMGKRNRQDSAVSEK
jgi:hypothetical protein